MTFSKNYYLLMLLAAVFTFQACQDDDDHDHDHDHDNEITIRILEPTDDEVFADATDVHIHIEVEASDSNHDVKIKLYPEGDADDMILDEKLHDHEQLVTFEQDLDLSSYASGTEFHLEVEACKDHDCEEEEKADVHFSIQ
jgi:hypothetical protein